MLSLLDVSWWGDASTPDLQAVDIVMFVTTLPFVLSISSVCCFAALGIANSFKENLGKIATYITWCAVIFFVLNLFVWMFVKPNDESLLLQFGVDGEKVMAAADKKVASYDRQTVYRLITSRKKERQVSDVEATDTKVKLKVMQTKPDQICTYATPGSSGLDLRADETFTVPAGGVSVIRTGVRVEIPVGYEGQVRGRSGLAARGILGFVGTIDSDYRGELGVILFNSTNKDYVVEQGDRVGQFVVSPVVQCELETSAELSVTKRGEDGFGSTGK